MLEHVDLLRSGPRDKEIFNPPFIQLPDIWKKVLKAALGKRCSNYLGLIFVKHLRILVKLLQKLAP